MHADRLIPASFAIRFHGQRHRPAHICITSSSSSSLFLPYIKKSHFIIHELKKEEE
jgi:hypothetical protein